MRATKSARSLLVVIASGLLMLMPAASMATVYKCNTEQALEWNNGHLVPDNAKFSKKHQVLLFNDETGELSVAFDEGSPYTPIHLDIVQKVSPDSDLIALSTTAHSNFVESELFRIRTWDKDAGIVFLYYSSGYEITTGKCHVGHY